MVMPATRKRLVPSLVSMVISCPSAVPVRLASTEPMATSPSSICRRTSAGRPSCKCSGKCVCRAYSRTTTFTGTSFTRASIMRIASTFSTPGIARKSPPNDSGSTTACARRDRRWGRGW